MPIITIDQTESLPFSSDSSNLLEFLEQKKYQVNFQCREGYCGACRCKLLSGQVQYLQEPLAFVRRGEFLPCCSIPITDLSVEIPK